MSGAGLHMETDFGGGFQYGGRFRGRVVLIWRQVSEAIYNNMEAVLFFIGASFSHVKAKPVNLYRRYSRRGSLHKSI
jgi:hypothetical protein